LTNFFSVTAVYDFFYHLFHRALHLRSVYKYIHKHHHMQHAPSRGNVDAVNVHPFEFVCGEYNHLLAIFLVPCHVVTAALFVVLGGVIASLNHTRYSVSFFNIFDVKFHDQHHVVPTVNYGQYLMLWDHLFGTYQEYPHEKLMASKGKEE
jgi:sterol desaturase/sphingolipid hydroxylase (fatty acid hydroxylase superfamily)